MQCLVFRLYGPMASWGSTAIGGVRPTRAMPSRSAIVGLLGAALGLTREREEELAQLNDSVLIAIKCESAGVLLRDYHTAQVPEQDRKAVWPHRKAELENGHKDVNTILSTRDYRADGHWLVALTLTEHATHALEAFRDVLKEPVFPLFLGRKSCPLAAPVHPVLCETESVHQALSDYQHPISYDDGEQAVLYAPHIEYQWDRDQIVGLSPEETSEHWDKPASRLRWQFEKRLVHSARQQRSQ